MRILVVEDEKKVANFIQRGLQEEKYHVEIARDGSAGLSKALEQHYDAIILDVMLPEKDGFSVVRELRNAGKNTPVLILTARGTTQDRVTGLDLGADDYLPKPFHFEELTARLRSLLRRSSSDKATVLRCGNISLDTVTHKAHVDDNEIELTTKEYALLEYMMRNKGRILSRSMIIQHVWNYSFDTESNIIDVYVKRLRKKINDTDEPKTITSIRGVGYRMNAPEVQGESS